MVGHSGVEEELHGGGVNGGTRGRVVSRFLFPAPGHAGTVFSDPGVIERVKLFFDDRVPDGDLGAWRDDSVWLVGHGLCLVDQAVHFGVHRVLPCVEVWSADGLLIVDVHGQVGLWVILSVRWSADTL